MKRDLWVVTCDSVFAARGSNVMHETLVRNPDVRYTIHEFLSFFFYNFNPNVYSYVMVKSYRNLVDS